MVESVNKLTVELKTLHFYRYFFELSVWLLLLFVADVFICGGYNGEVILDDLWKINLQTFQWNKLPAVMPEPAYFHCAAVTPVRLFTFIYFLSSSSIHIYSNYFFFISFFSQAGCMYIHGGVVNIHENKRTGSLFKIWLVVPSLLELCWDRLLKSFPHLAQLTPIQLLNLGLTQELIERLKWRGGCVREGPYVYVLCVLFFVLEADHGQDNGTWRQRVDSSSRID